MTSGRRRIARLVDRADPEAPLRIGLAVVEALDGRVVRRRVSDRFELARRGVEDGEAGAQCQQHQRACRAPLCKQRRAAAHVGVEAPVAMARGRGVEAVQFVPGDVAPVQHLLRRVPARRLAELVRGHAGQGVQRFLQHPGGFHAGVGHDQGAGDADPIAFLAQQLHRAKLELDLGHVVDESHGVRWM